MLINAADVVKVIPEVLYIVMTDSLRQHFLWGVVLLFIPYLWISKIHFWKCIFGYP